MKVITTKLGQWKYPGEITKIPGNNITMKDVNYPVLGISNTGDTKIMIPNNNYKFKGKNVTEFPIKANNTILYPNTGDYIFNTNKVIETPMLTRNYRPTFQMGGQPQMEQPEQGQEQQIMQMVAQALQQGTPPEQVMQMLVQQGIPPEQAQQIIQEVMTQMQGQMSQQQPTDDMQQAQPMVKHGGMLQFLQKGGRTVSDVSSDYDGFYQQKYSNPRYMQSVIDAENSQVPIQSNNGLVGPPEYVAPQAQLNYNRPQEFTREQVFGNLNFGSQPKVMKSVQRAKVPTFTKATTLAEASTKASNKGAGTFIHNNKLYTTEPKTYKDKRLNPNASFITNQNSKINQRLSNYENNKKLNSFERLENSYNAGKTFLDLRGKEKQNALLALPDKILTYASQNIGLPVAKTLTGVGTTRDKIQTALSVIPFLGGLKGLIPTTKMYPYGAPLVDDIITNNLKMITQGGSKLLKASPKMLKEAPKMLKTPVSRVRGNINTIPSGVWYGTKKGITPTLKKLGRPTKNTIKSSQTLF